jgi:hypothetical protein
MIERKQLGIQLFNCKPNLVESNVLSYHLPFKKWTLVWEPSKPNPGLRLSPLDSSSHSPHWMCWLHTSCKGTSLPPMAVKSTTQHLSVQTLLIPTRTTKGTLKTQTLDYSWVHWILPVIHRIGKSTPVSTPVARELSLYRVVGEKVQPNFLSTQRPKA